MRFLHSLLLLAAIGFVGTCGSERPIHLPVFQIPPGKRGVNFLVEHSAIKIGDRVDVIGLQGERETVVLTNVELAALTAVDAKRDATSCIVSPEEAGKLTEASELFKFRLRLSHT
ncbi:MAG: hypothetical protein WCA20_22070 [Candidatus Sulfotelmatobacter sp.]